MNPDTIKSRRVTTTAESKQVPTASEIAEEINKTITDYTSVNGIMQAVRERIKKLEYGDRVKITDKLKITQPKVYPRLF